MSPSRAYLIAAAIAVACLPVAFAAAWLLEGQPSMALEPEPTAVGWIEQSEVICGPGYVTITQASVGWKTTLCISYKLPEHPK